MTAFTQLLAQRPELIALAIFVVAFGTLRSTTKPQTLRRILIGAVFFLGFTYSLYQAREVPYIAPVGTRDPLTGFLGDSLKTIWWFWVASLAAESLRLSVLDHVELLARFPFIGPPYERDRTGRAREIQCGVYRIFYRVNEAEKRVEILTVWHGSRSEPTLPE